MDDIIPAKKSIRDIPLPANRQNKVVNQTVQETITVKKETIKKEEPKEKEPIIISRPSKNKGPSKVLLLGMVALIAGVLFAFLLFLSKATVEIQIKSENISVALSATSTKDGDDGTIPYSTVIVEKAGTIDLQATTTGNVVKRKASGTITIYNNHNPESHTLVATTRFQTKEGLVYRIDKSVTIPPQTVQNGQTIPGTIDAVVYADQPGPSYNIGKTDFTVPGFQGTDKATTFYAKSRTDITGGYEGSESIVSDTELNNKKSQLQENLRQALLLDVASATPDTFLFFGDGLAIDFTSNTEVEGGKTILRGKAVALAPVFNKRMLTEVINRANNTKYTALDGFDKLEASISNTEGLVAGDFPELYLSLNGTVNIGQEINIGELQRALAGKKKADLTEILSAYTSVESSKAHIRPFWKTRFPSDSDKIEIKVLNEAKR